MWEIFSIYYYQSKDSKHGATVTVACISILSLEIRPLLELTSGQWVYEISQHGLQSQQLADVYYKNDVETAVWKSLDILIQLKHDE